MFIKERQPTKLTEVLSLADQYRDAHTDPRVRRMKDKPSHSGAQQSSNHMNRSTHGPSNNSTNRMPNNSTNRFNNNSTNNRDTPRGSHNF